MIARKINCHNTLIKLGKKGIVVKVGGSNGHLDSIEEVQDY